MLNMLATSFYRYSIKGLLLFCIALLYTGCDSVDVSSPSSPPQSVGESRSIPASEAITVADGRLVFTDQEEFDAFMDVLIEQPSHDDLEIVGLDGDFVSLETMQNIWLQEVESRETEHENDQDISDFLEVERVVEDPLFARVLNHDGQIQIGNTVYKVTYDYVYATAYGADDVLDAIPLKGNALSFKGNSSIDIHPVVRHKKDISSDVIGKSKGAVGNGDCKSTFSNNHRRRIKGEMWATWWFFHTSVGSEIEAQRRRLRRWKQTKMSKIIMFVNGQIRYYDYDKQKNDSKPINSYKSKSEAREIRVTHHNNNWNQVDLNGFFEGRYGGEDQSCTSNLFKS